MIGDRVQSGIKYDMTVIPTLSTEPQLSAHHLGILVVPSTVTHRAPHTVVAHLHSSLVARGAIDQPHISIHTAVLASDWIDKKNEEKHVMEDGYGMACSVPGQRTPASLL